MKLIILACCVFFSFQALNASAEEKNSNAAPELTDLFSGSSSPGEGSLIYSNEVEKETITLGVDSGIYGLGLVFKGEWLAEPLKKELSKNLVIQLALGTSKSKLEGKVPQFGLVTLIAPALPKEITAFTFKDPSKKETSSQSQAMLYFTSPKTQLGQTDQEKLQNTFFGKTGGITVTPVGEAEQVSVRTPQTQVTFKKQNMKFDFQTALATPFSGLEKKLTGSIIFPVYSPHGKAAEALAMRIVASLPSGAPTPSKRLAPARKITSSPEKK
jgi:hypothetical protein